MCTFVVLQVREGPVSLQPECEQIAGLSEEFVSRGEGGGVGERALFRSRRFLTYSGSEAREGETRHF